MLSLLLALLAADPFTSPKPPTAEYGHGLTAEQAHEGWISLFDGETSFGWREGKVESGSLSADRTTSKFGSCELKGEVAAAGELQLGDAVVELPVGLFKLELVADKPRYVRLNKSIAVKSLLLRPSGLKPMFNGRDLTGWRAVKHPQLPEEKQAKWGIEDGVLHAVGGPGAVELDGRYGDVVLQVEARMRANLANGGVFFRSIPADFMNGYEAQLFNGCYDEDPGKPARYSTGAIDDRQLARRLVSRDLEPLTMTVIAVGPHIATWVNGFQTTDWTDDREPHDNPRMGLRLAPGAIQLQAHDADTDIEFRRVLVADLGETKLGEKK
jgi:hypothetical protein